METQLETAFQNKCNIAPVGHTRAQLTRKEKGAVGQWHNRDGQGGARKNNNFSGTTSNFKGSKPNSSNSRKTTGYNGPKPNIYNRPKASSNYTGTKIFYFGQKQDSIDEPRPSNFGGARPKQSANDPNFESLFGHKPRYDNDTNSQSFRGFKFTSGPKNNNINGTRSKSDTRPFDDYKKQNTQNLRGDGHKSGSRNRNQREQNPAATQSSRRQGPPFSSWNQRPTRDTVTHFSRMEPEPTIWTLSTNCYNSDTNSRNSRRVSDNTPTESNDDFPQIDDVDPGDVFIPCPMKNNNVKK